MNQYSHCELKLCLFATTKGVIMDTVSSLKRLSECFTKKKILQQMLVHTWTQTEAHTCLQFMTRRRERELIKTKYVCLTVPLYPLSPARAMERVSGSYLPCWNALRGNQKRMTEWKRPFRQWAQKTCKKRGKKDRGEAGKRRRGWGWRQQEIPKREKER